LLEASVRQWEDPQALTAPKHGLAFIERIIKQAPLYLKHPNILDQSIPQVIIEIGDTQASAVQQLMHNAQYQNVHIWRDIFGKDRVILGTYI
jgi:methylase of polypeptide subunit release factors